MKYALENDSDPLENRFKKLLVKFIGVKTKSLTGADRPLFVYSETD